MKKFLTIFLIAFSILINAQSDPNIKWLHPSPQGWDILWMKMWDTNNWYAAGAYGVFMKTTDAGQTWTTNNRAGWPNEAYPNALTNWDAYKAWFFDQNNGIICPRNGAGILKTSDGGETFDTLRILPGIPGGKNVRGIYFVNSNLGFICGNSQYKIFKTTDGGNTWNQVPNLDAVTYYDVFATSELNITACSDGGKIYKTTDGGASWNIIQLGTAQPLYDLEFANDTIGYVCGGVGYFHCTTDGGFTWLSGANTPSSYTNYQVRVVNNDIYVAGDYTKLFKSTDNGNSWSTFNLPASTLYPGFSYCMDVVGSTIVAAGRWGNIYKSTDSGSNFTNLSQRFTDFTSGSSLYVESTTGKIIATGHWSDFPGSIIYSNDGGDNWQASPFVSGQTTMLNRLQMFDSNNGYFAGDGGYFGKSTDGGINLTPITIPFNGGKNFIDLDFISQSTGWLVGGPNGPGSVIIAKTTDGGLNWTDQSIITLGGRIKGIDMVDANIGYFAHATVQKTTNSGTNWTPQTLPGAAFLEDVDVFDADNVYAVGAYLSGTTNYGAFYKTTNGGTNWTQVTTPVLPTFVDQDWYDMNNGVIVGTLGLILLTDDGGTTWTIMNTGGWTSYHCQMISPDTFYIASGNGQVFRYAKPSTQTTFQVSVNVNNGWNMVSVPGINSDGMGVGNWWAFREPGSLVYKYLGGYQSVTTTASGEGYWMKQAGQRTYNTGDEWPAGGIQIVAHDPLTGASGWNLIGGYEIAATASLVTTNPLGLQSGFIYGYSNGYQQATTIDPGFGYWIKLTGAGQIIIPETFAKGNEEVENFSDKWGRIILTDANGISYTLYAISGDVDLTQYELPPAPMTGMFDIRYSSGRIAEDLSNSKTIEMNSVTYPVKIKVQNMNIRLQDETGKELSKSLQPGEEFIINDNTIKKLTVLSSEIIAPLEYALEQNYPNPFNPSTNIKFALAEASDVSLTIYNTLGQKVKELVNEKLEAGRYNYQWNASDVATGMYIYELRAANFVSVKKMILLK